jgi:integrase/recombinase XerD
LQEEIIIRVLDKASETLNKDQVNELRNILSEVLQDYTVSHACMALALTNNLSGMIRLYLASKKLDGLSLKTLKNYLLILDKFSNSIHVDAESITAMNVRMFLALYQKAGIKNSTMATIIWTLKSFFSWLRKEEYISKDPMLKIATTKFEKRIRKALTQEELEMLRLACKTPRDKALVEFFYSTGCRLSEVTALNKSDINWNTDSCMVFGKGSKERQVFLNAKARVHLWRYLDYRKDDTEALFVSDRLPHERLKNRSVEEVFMKLGKRAGMGKRVHPHLLRHTTATSLLNNGASLAAVQKILGHEDCATTQIYAQLNNEEIQTTHKKHLA